MELATISILSWNRFRSRSLYIAPEVVGKSHRFSFEGFQVTISLPTLKVLTPREDLMKIEHEDVLLHYNSWKEENGEEHPLAYWVTSVDVEVYNGNPIKVPKGVLNHSPNAYDIVSPKRQSRLNKIADIQEELAERAFDYWLRVMRWISDNSSIGRPDVRGHDSGWSTYLLDANTRNRIWIGNTILTVRAGKPVTLQQWKRAGKILKNGMNSPLYFDYYLDALEHFELGDLNRCIVDLAVSCEALMRSIIGNKLPPTLLGSINKYIDKANISNYYEDFIPDLLNPVKKRKYRILKKDIKELFNERNSIVHGKKRISTDLVTCKRFISMTRNLMELLPQSR